MATAAAEEVVPHKPYAEEVVPHKPYAEEVVPQKLQAEEEPPLAAVMEKPSHVVQDKPLAPPPHHYDSNALAKVPDAATAKKKGSLDRDVALAKLEDDKRLSFVKAWEESEKTKVENKAQKKLSEVSAWENSKKASLESKLKKIEETLETKKAEYAEKMKNKVAQVHKEAEEKRAMVEARRGEDLLKAEELAAKYRVTGHVPKKALGCLGC